MKSRERSMRLRNAFAKANPGGSLWLVKWLVLLVLLILVLLAVVFRGGSRSVDAITENSTEWHGLVSTLLPLDLLAKAPVIVRALDHAGGDLQIQPRVQTFEPPETSATITSNPRVGEDSYSACVYRDLLT